MFWYKFAGGSITFAGKTAIKTWFMVIIRKLVKRKVYSSFKDNIWNTDLADQFLLCIIYIFSK